MQPGVLQMAIRIVQAHAAAGGDGKSFVWELLLKKNLLYCFCENAAVRANLPTTIYMERMIMAHPVLSEDIRPLSRLGSQAAKLLKEARRNRRPVFLTSKGEAAGVFMDIAEYERLLELKRFRKAVRASIAQADRGEVISHEQAIKESKRWIKKTTK